jgi:hypothetical protein
MIANGEQIFRRSRTGGKDAISASSLEAKQYYLSEKKSTDVRKTGKQMCFENPSL